MRAAIEFPLALVLAPAGFGKSEALRQLLAEVPAPTYTLGPGNESLLGFLRGFSAALQSIAPHAAATLADAHAATLRSPTRAYDLAAWLHAHIREFSGLIAIDEFHVAAADANVCKLVGELVERTDGKIRWIIATRDAGTLPLATWTAYGRLGPPVTAADLLFTRDEAAHFRSARDASSKLEKIYGLTRGWPVAFRFAAEISAFGGDLAGIATGTREKMYRYLAEQVFHQRDERERSFLLDTCLYPRVDLALLITAGHDDAGRIIEALRRRTSFIQIESEGVYRYHDLFRDFLKTMVRRKGAPSFAEAIARAGQALERGGNAGDALRLYAEAPLYGRIAQTLERFGPELMDAGNADVVERSVALMRSSGQNISPPVLALEALLETERGHFAESDALAALAFQNASDPLERGQVAYQAARAIVNRDPSTAARMLEHSADRSALPAELQAQMCSLLAATYAIILDPPPSARADESIAYALRILPTSANDAVRASVHLRAGYVAYASNKLRAAREQASLAVELGLKAGCLRVVGSAYSILNTVAGDEDDLPDAGALMRLTEDFAERSGNLDLRFLAICDRIHYEAEHGNTERAEELESAHRDILQAAMSPVAGNLLCARALSRAGAGDFAAAYDIRHMPERPASRALAWQAARWAEVALYAAAAGDRARAFEAVELAEGELINAGARAPVRCSAHALSFCALALLVGGRSDAANGFIARAEALLDSMPARAAALVAATRSLHTHALTGLDRDAVTRSIAALRSAGYGGYACVLEKLPLPEPSPASTLARLTESELHVLRELGAGATSQAIATRTGRKKRTVDWHVEALCKKLGAPTRRAAVAIARAKGLIS